MSHEELRTPISRSNKNCVTEVFGETVDKSEINEQDPNGNTAILLAASHNHTDIAQILLGEGCDINITNLTGHSPLHYAVVNGNTTLVDSFLRAGADVNSPTRIKNTLPVHLATAYGFSDILELLIRFGADINFLDRKGRSPLILAAERAQMDVLRVLLHSNVNPNQHGRRGQTALHVAVNQGSYDLCQQLLEVSARCPKI